MHSGATGAHPRAFQKSKMISMVRDFLGMTSYEVDHYGITFTEVETLTVQHGLNH